MRPETHTHAGASCHAQLIWVCLCVGMLVGMFAAGGASAQADVIARSAGQPEVAPGPFDGRFVQSVRVLVAGPNEADFHPADPSMEQLVRNQIRTGRGSREYDQRIAAEDIERLNRLGRFASVEQLIAEFDDGTIEVTFRLREQPIITDVQVEGNRRISAGKLSKAIEFLAGTPVDQFEIDRAARAIEDLYREKGFYLASVHANLDELLSTGVVLFEIREGLRIKITEIRFDGNASFRRSELSRQIKTRTANIFVTGPLDDEQIRADARTLARYYKDHGYLDARVDSRVQTSPDNREAIVTFYIDEGPLYTLRRIVARHADADAQGPVLTGEQIVGLVEMKPGDTYSVRKVEDAVARVNSAYGQMGYADVRVSREEVRDPIKPLVDLRLEINQGRRYRTGLVRITGNTTTRQNEIRKLVQVRPDRPMDTPAVDQSRRIIANSRLFDVQNSPPRTSILRPDPKEPNYRDLLVEVTETNTGTIGFGASVNSDAGLIGNFTFTQRNFDITDTPDSIGDLFSGKSFRGGGQTFRIQAQPGTQFATYSASLVDNSINDSDIGGSFGFTFRQSQFSEFDEDRRGFNAAISRRFGQRWRGSVDLRWQAIDITNLDANSTTDAFMSEGANQLSGIGFGLRRTTIAPEDQFRPGRGSVISLGAEQVGLMGGDFQFTKLSAEHTVFLTLSEDYLGRRTVLRLKARAAYIPQGQRETPVFERYYLGGRSMRGLDFRTVGPRGVANDTGLPSTDPIGGTWLFFWGAEIQQPLYADNIALAFFMDTGTVRRRFGFDQYRVTIGTGLRLHVPQLSPAPLAFDFGFPVLKESTDENRLFTFNVDIPF